VDPIGARVVGASLAQFESAHELRVDRGCQSLDLLGGQLARECVRRELGGVQDLVRPGPADSGERPLVAEQWVQPTGVGGADLSQPGCAEAERLRAEVCQLELGFLGIHQPDAGALLGARLGQDELGPTFEAQTKRRCLRAFLAGAQVAEAAGGHQVDEKDEFAILGREQEALCATPRPG
jgi:hypothetical protein